MGKEKANTQRGPAQKHLHSRISYLYQAATYLSNLDSREEHSNTGPITDAPTNEVTHGGLQSSKSGEPNPPRMYENVQTQTMILSKGLPLSRLFVSHLRAVSLKGQIRLTHEMKRSICKCCNCLLVPGSTSTTSMENKSRGGRKPWADVLVMSCTTCGAVKRFPVGAKRQLRRRERQSMDKRSSGNDDTVPTG